jgi:NADPH:quinone reductase-like Zn-dependent oxidoreductase
MLSPFTGQHPGTLLCSENQADLLALTELIESGQVTPAIDKTYPLSETITAIRHMRDGHARGKVIINISDAKAIAETPREAKQLGPIGH